MLSINMRIFKTVLMLAVFYAGVKCVPVERASNGSSSIDEPAIPTPVKLNSTDEVIYDQRQNGTENFHIHLDGLLFLIAPAEDLVLPIAAAAATGGKPDLSTLNHPKPSMDKPEPKRKLSSTTKSAHRVGLRLADLLLPLMRQFHHQ